MTEEKIARWIKEGRGTGAGADYKPWLTIHDVASIGLSTRVKGLITGRNHHLLSKLELQYFYVLDIPGGAVVDIREQWPLLPLDETMTIAERLGLTHPEDPGTGCPVVMTTDLLVTVRQGLDEVLYARTVKHVRRLDSQRNMEKFEIERQYYRSRNIDWRIITERNLPAALVSNAELVHRYFLLDDREDLSQDQIYDIALVLTRLVTEKTLTLRDAAAQSDERLGLPRGTSLPIAYHLVATGQWRINMRRRVNPARRLKVIAVDSSLLQKGV